MQVCYIPRTNGRSCNEARCEQLNISRDPKEELQKIDEALVAVRRDKVATEEEVEAVFAKYRRYPSSPSVAVISIPKPPSPT